MCQRGHKTICIQHLLCDFPLILPTKHQPSCYLKRLGTNQIIFSNFDTILTLKDFYHLEFYYTESSNFLPRGTVFAHTSFVNYSTVKHQFSILLHRKFKLPINLKSYDTTKFVKMKQQSLTR